MLDTKARSASVKGMYIGGQRRDMAASFDDTIPSNGALFATMPDGGRTEARAVIEAAQRAFPVWSSSMFQERAHLMLKTAEVWERRAPDYIAAAVAEGGGWYGKGAFEAGYVAEVFRTAAAICYSPIGDVFPSARGKISTATRYPIGVVSVISPWNMPALLSARLRLSHGRRQHHRTEAVRRNALCGRAFHRGGAGRSRGAQRRLQRGDLLPWQCRRNG